MRSIESWLAEYNESHQNSFNKLTHWICVPAIMISLLGLLWTIQTPGVFQKLPFPFNWAVIMMLMAMLYYFMLSVSLAVGMLVVAAGMLLLIAWLDKLPVSLWLICVIVFIIAWVGQFIGHMVEGKRPSFFKDLQFLLIGPLWLLSFVYQKLNIKY